MYPRPLWLFFVYRKLAHTETAGIPVIKAKKEKETGGECVHNFLKLAEFPLECQVEFG